jgi:hypothetical protein
VQRAQATPRRRSLSRAVWIRNAGSPRCCAQSIILASGIRFWDSIVEFAGEVAAEVVASPLARRGREPLAKAALVP